MSIIVAANLKRSEIDRRCLGVFKCRKRLYKPYILGFIFLYVEHKEANIVHKKSFVILLTSTLSSLRSTFKANCSLNTTSG